MTTFILATMISMNWVLLLSIAARHRIHRDHVYKWMLEQDQKIADLKMNRYQELTRNYFKGTGNPNSN